MRRPLALALAVAVGCGSSGGSRSPAADASAPTLSDGLPAACNPLRAPGICLLPWPSAIYTTPDATTATGYRVALDEVTLPVSGATKLPLDPTRWNAADGFSPAGPILAYFPEPLDPASLVPEADIAASLAPGAGTVIVDMTTNERVAHFSQPDANATKSTDHQALVITPAARLLPARRYAVAVTRSVRTTSGGAPTPPPLFDAIAAGTPPKDTLAQAEAARMPAVLASLEKAGVARSDVLVAWDFVTGTDDYLTAHVLSMRDQGLAMVGPTGAGYTIDEVDDQLDAQVLRRIVGTFTVPQFIDNADESKPEAQLTFDADGAPKLLGTYQAPFTIIVPAVAATKGPLPIIVYGHGLFGNAEEELGDASGSYVQDFANTFGYVVVATDWIGLSSHEDPADPGSNGALGDVLTDMNDLPWMTDRLQQALLNAMVLERTMVGRIVLDPAMTVSGTGGAKVADASNLTYYGISLGGIMGMSFMGYDPYVTRGALDVGGGFWSTLFERSIDWRLADVLLSASYPDALQVQLLLALMQMQFDFSDPATVAPHVLAAPLAGVPKKQVLLQMGLGDADVPNVAAEMTARTAGLPLLRAPVTTPYGLTVTSGPLSSAFSTWNVNAPPVPPSTNATPIADNQTHEAIRRVPQVEAQITTFLQTGQVVDTCDGAPCVEPIPPGTPAPSSF